MNKKPGRKPSRFQLDGLTVTDNGAPIYTWPNPQAASAYLALCRAMGGVVQIVEVQS